MVFRFMEQLREYYRVLYAHTRLPLLLALLCTFVNLIEQ